MKHTNLYLRRFLLICFYFVFVLDPTREMSKLLAVIVLTFSVRRPRILLFLLKKVLSIWENFNYVIELFQDLFFTFLLY